MNILIIEDEARIARRLERMTTDFFASTSVEISICDSLQKGLDQIADRIPDLLLLDLNLNGDNGFEILEHMVASSFHTIIVSANIDKAITAFAYGVLDFVPKPFDQERFFKALTRFVSPALKVEEDIKYLAVKKAGQVRLINIAEVVYIKGAGIYTELHLNNGRTELHDKSLELLHQLLPDQFERVHKSYLVNFIQVEKMLVNTGTRYSVLLKSGEILPVGRSRYKDLKNRIV
ncbi:LytTR family transcriptional regulator DNA-binding domain-containing protein [Chryseobacterium sp. MEBOG06]|uniref:LytR/AlgR family response regulator transcription factor n=1 Tax=unclassified Chryseobacterium TaxID=2593645 RepID=UPI001F009795|nr:MULTISPECIES: LytTR family transcriptional regulator DNA-binding domain-containing protein [unclassified Chryseobacterium]UKB85770.1 LytTR family transcriptional regulator DNA-binding domain-containing protein [Chryseobacterium sp. MEBOG06]